MARGRTPRRGELAVKITVFGGSGFLGSHICDKLSEAGHAVTIVDLHPSPWLRPDQTMLTGNILDEETVRRGVEGADMVFNYAGIADIGEANNRPVDTARINVLGNVMILEACRRERVRRYVFASSLYVYGKSGGFYRCSKQACEIYIENYQAMHKLPYTILRYGSLYGPRADNRNAIYRFVREALEKKHISYFGHAKALREYIHVEDAAVCSVEILKPEYANKHIVLSGHQPMRVGDVLKMIQEILGEPIEFEFLADDQSGHYEITPYSFNPQVGYKMTPRLSTDLGQGILRVIEDVHREINSQMRSAHGYLLNEESKK